MSSRTVDDTWCGRERGQSLPFCSMMAENTGALLVVGHDDFLQAYGWGYRQRANFLKSSRNVLYSGGRMSWAVTFLILATTQKKGSGVGVFTSRFLMKYRIKHFLKPLLYAAGHIIVTALGLFKVSHPWFTMIKFSSSPSPHTSYTATYLQPFHHSPLAATCTGSCWALRWTLVLAPCSPPPLGFPADSQR